MVRSNVQTQGIFMGRDNKESNIITVDRIKKDNVNNNVLGVSGKAEKLRWFKEREFRQELAPQNAIIEHEEIGGEKFILMKY